MSPLRDGELLWASKDCLPQAIACRERIFLHKMLQSIPFPGQHTYFMLRGIGQPNVLQSKLVVLQLQNDFQQYRRQSAPCSFWAAALEILYWAATSAPLALRCPCHDCLVPCSWPCPLDYQHMHRHETFRGIVEIRQHLGEKPIINFSIAGSLYWYPMNPWAQHGPR